MKNDHETRVLKLAALAACMALAACGGGGGGGNPPPAPTPASVDLTGTVASGAAFVDAVVTIYDKTGTLVGTSDPVGTSGTYAVTLASGAQAPLVLVASRTSATSGEVSTLVSVARQAVSGIVNVTPVTTLAAALLSPSGDPARLAQEAAANASLLAPAAIDQKLAAVQATLKPLLDAAGVAAVDPVSGPFSADGTGYDRLLDSLLVQIVPASDTASNIAVGVKQKTGDDAQPVEIQFTSDQAALPVLPAVSEADLVPSGLAQKVTDFLARLTACFALPLEQRVNNATASDQAVTGTAADVTAAACKDAFSGQAPASYLSNGNRVGRDSNSNGAFTGLFRRNATGVVFSGGSYEFIRGNGDYVIRYKQTTSAGGVSHDSFVLRLDGDGKLRLIGNQYLYAGSVTPYHQLRQFITLDQSAYDYHSTGYTLDVPNNGLFSKVEVTGPSGGAVTLVPSAGYPYLVLQKPSGAITGTSVVRLRAEFIDPDGSHRGNSDFRTLETGLVFSSNPAYATDAGITAIPNQSRWTFRYYLASDPGTVAATQYRTTFKRALGIAEIRTRGLSQFTAATVAALQASADPTTGRAAPPASGPIPVGWTVPGAALPAIGTRAYGSSSGQGFQDNAGVALSARSAAIYCYNQSASDAHCTPTGNYADGVTLSGLDLLASDDDGRLFANFYATYKVKP